MQKGYAKSEDSIYFSCRKDAGKYNDALNSRAGASEMLNVSEASLRNYELGLTPVPVDVVVRMADLYGAPELRASYCKHDCPIGKFMSRTVSDEVKGIGIVTCSLLHHIQEAEVKGAVNILLRIASDGKITGEELQELRGVVQFLEEAVKDVSELRLIMEKESGADGAG